MTKSATPPHQLFVLQAITPLHVGVDDALGSVDQPTMRERHTGYPLVPGSSVKGVLREAAEISSPTVDSADVLFAFGPPRDHAGDFRGGLVFTDAQLLALPVRSLSGTFAWITCSGVLRRLDRDLELAGLDRSRSPVPEVPNPASAWVSDHPVGSALQISSASNQVFLEELRLSAEEKSEVSILARWIAAGVFAGEPEAAEFFKRRLLVVHDNVFAFFSRVGLEVRSRVKIDHQTGTAADSGPWTEEHIPAEALLCGLTHGRPTLFKKRPSVSRESRAFTNDPGIHKGSEDSLAVLRRVASEATLLRFGGQATIGLGRARFHLFEAASALDQEVIHG